MTRNNNLQDALLNLILILVFWFLVPLLFKPIRLMEWIGSKFSMGWIVDRLFLISPEQAKILRDDLTETWAEEANELLNQNSELGSIPSRHISRREALRSVSQSHSKSSSGEVLVSGILALIGISASIISLFQCNAATIPIVIQLCQGQLLTAASLLVSSVGISAVLLSVLRLSVSESFAYDNYELSNGSNYEIATKAGWNLAVAGKPQIAVKAYYTLKLAQAFGEDTYQLTLEFWGTQLGAGHRANKSGIKWLRQMTEAIESDLASDQG